jgi:hypothetical protein
VDVVGSEVGVRTHIERERFPRVTYLRVSLMVGGRGFHWRSAPVVPGWHIVRHIGLREAVASHHGHRRHGGDHVFLLMDTTVHVPVGHDGNRSLQRRSSSTSRRMRLLLLLLWCVCGLLGLRLLRVLFRVWI